MMQGKLHLIADVASAAPADDHLSSSVLSPEALTTWETAAENLLFLAVDIGIVCLTIAFGLCFCRLLRGPTLADRGLASDTLSMQVVGLAILLTIRMRTLAFFDAALIIAILGFASTLAYAQFIARRRSV